MTQADFFSYVTLQPSSLNVWYDENGPPYTVRGVSIPVIDRLGEDSSKYLSQVTQISIPLSGGSVEDLVLQISSRSSGIANGIRYYIFLVEPKTIDSLGDVSTTTTSTVLLMPTIDTEVFASSPYNVLGGFVQNARQSSYIMQSDRYKVGILSNPTYTGPLNIEALLEGSATKASIQESNYSSLSWIRSRYDGTKTNRIDYKVDPALAGRTFVGAEFASGSQISQINYLLSSSQVDYKDFFYAGRGDVPGFDTNVYTGMRYLTNYSNPNTNQIQITSANNVTNPPYRPYEGDLIVNNTGSPPEFIKILSVGAANTPVTYSLNVSRGYLSTPNGIAGGTQLTRVEPVQIYNIENNKLSGVPKGRIIVKETGKTLGIDSLGYVISST